MNDIIFEALKLLIMVCVAVIARYVIPWLKSRIEQDKMAAIEKMVTQAVLYAQQVLTSKSGAEKKAIVTDLLKEMRCVSETGQRNCHCNFSLTQLHGDYAGMK